MFTARFYRKQKYVHTTQYYPAGGIEKYQKLASIYPKSAAKDRMAVKSEQTYTNKSTKSNFATTNPLVMYNAIRSNV